jgi:hypothetical protein
MVFAIFAFQSANVSFSLNAAIIDQLARDVSNQTFVENVTAILKSRGFNVVRYDYTDTDVEFFKELAKGNYGIIILRVHSALRNDSSTVDLFTSEEYVPGRYHQEIENGLVVIGNYSYDPTKFYYAITYRFIEKLEGYFPKSIIVAMGCWSLKSGLQHSLAEAFINTKKAKAYIGWTDIIFPSDTDADTITFLEKFLIQNKTLEDSTAGLRHTYYGNINTSMQFYPLEARNLKISDLLVEVKSSKISTPFNLNVLSFLIIKVEFLRTKLKIAY